MTDIKRLAENIILCLSAHTETFISLEDRIKEVESILREAMEKQKAQWDAEVFGESYMLDGKRIRLDEMLKEPKDWMNEAYTRAVEVARKHGECVSLNCGDSIAAAIEKLREETK